MKIAVSICETKNQFFPSEVFKKCSHFLVFNSDNNRFKILINPFFNILGLDGIQTAIFLLNYGIDVLITKGIEINSLRFFDSAKIKIYNYKGKTPKEAIKLYRQHKLSEFKLLPL